MTATKVRKEERTRSGAKARTEPRWNVVLHNDWVNSMPRVIWVLVKVIPGMTVKRATKVMWEAHTKGRAAAKTCHKELAELYEERLQEKGLTVGIEPSR
jgi:ATP-dependent Clp protease adaptor protein ClpS